MIRILLVDDQALLCEVLQTWLNVEDDLNVVGIAHNGQEAVEKAEILQPDIVLMDIDMPHMDGLNATKIIAQRFPNIKVIFLSGHDDDAYLGKSLRAGAKGYLLKNTTAEELVSKIRSVSKNVNLLEQGNESDVLKSLQNQLEQLLDTYQDKFQKQLEAYQEKLDNIERLEQLELEYEERFQQLENSLQNKKFKDLETKNHNTWESIRKEIMTVNTQFSQANRNLTIQFNQQLANIKQEIDTKVASALDDWSRQRAALQEWAVQRDEMRPSIDEFESKYRDELMSVVNPLRSSFRDVNKQMRVMRHWLIATGLMAILALGLSGYVLISNLNLHNSSATPTSEEQR
jgi:YesN/AraC family two-component response regulator